MAKKAAMEKLEKIEKQADALDCKIIIPFASFVYFSNYENKYLNDKMNSPNDLKNYFKDMNRQIIFMKPFEKQEINNLSSNKESYNFWEDKIKNTGSLLYNKYNNEN